MNLKKITKILKALADESRVRIVALLKERDILCVCEITEIIGLSQPTISSHLKKLQDAEIITYSKDGLWVNYNLDENMEKEIEQLLGAVVRMLSEDEIIKSDILKSYKINREMICKK
ncbi:MAG: metalloregulator ArsR/SmtB family transcription factor [Actinobacteria bacterium]|nr:metalloregulator ArsR/SmtB family transcription factor [Actinomycetota bacterium]